jgi:two-component system, NtrC family, sensor kinase
MARAAKTAKAKVATKQPAARKSTTGHATKPELEHRLANALEQQAATAEILRVISSSRADAQPVFDAIVRSAVRLCGADHSIAARFDGEMLHPLAYHGFSPDALTIIKRTYPKRPTSGDMLGRATLKRAVDNLPDMLADSTYSHEFAIAGGWRSGLGVPMLRNGELIGAIAVSRKEPGAFPEHLVQLLTTFADQAVIAIENVRLFTELEARNADLTEALEQQTATAEILRVISASPTNIQPIFDVIGASAEKLCGAEISCVATIDGDIIHLAALHQVTSAGNDAVRRLFPMQLSAETVTARTIRSGSVVHVRDVLDDRSYAVKAAARAGGFRASLGVPMLREGRVIGSIFVARTEPGFFTDAQVDLLKIFADQAVIAIENVRLFTELQARNADLTEALEQQTATSEILRVISQSQTDVQPVFDTIVAAARKLCNASSANVVTFDGELIHLAAFVIVDPGYAAAVRQFFPRRPSRETGLTRAILTGSVISIPDVLEDAQYVSAAPELVANSLAGGFRSVLAVPLIRDGKAIGAIAVGRPEPGIFPEEQIALLQTFADQAVIAIENVRLFKELEARTTELTQSVGELKALGEVGQAVSSTLDLETVLGTIVSRATELAGMDAGSIYEYDQAGGEFHLHTSVQLPDELVTVLRATPIRKGEGALGRMAETGEPVQIHDIGDDHAYQSRVRELLIRVGCRSLLVIPLLREDLLLGGLAVYRTSAGEFSPHIIELLKTFATQSALAIQNARLFREIGDKSRQLEVASQHKSEFLANMSHELRTPLNAIIGFSEVLSERMFGEINDKQAEYLTDILESGRHLLSLINDILDLSKIEAGRMELNLSEFELPAAIENTMMLMRERAHRREIRLERSIDANVGTIRADERKVKQVLLNLLSNALKFTPEGGRIDVRATVSDGAVEISVKDSGVGIAPEDQATVFEEFRQVGAASKKIEGSGLGLAISRKFVELHGGRIRVESRVGRGSTFAFTVPLMTAAAHRAD